MDRTARKARPLLTRPLTAMTLSIFIMLLLGTPPVSGQQSEKSVSQPSQESSSKELYDRGVRLMEDQKYREAMRALMEASKKDPNDEKISEAKDKAVRLYVERIRSLLEQAEDLYQQRRFNDAMRTYKKILEEESDHKDALGGIQRCQHGILLERAANLQRNGHHKQALHIYRQLTKYSDSRADANRGIAEIYCGWGSRLLDRGAFQEAFVKFKRARRFHGSSSCIRKGIEGSVVGIADAYLTEGLYDDAIRCVGEGLTLAGESNALAEKLVECRLAKAMFLVNNGRLRDASRILEDIQREGLKFGPAYDPRLRRALDEIHARLLEKQGDESLDKNRLGSALLNYLAALSYSDHCEQIEGEQIEGKIATVYSRMARRSLEEGKITKACEELKRSLDFKPEDRTIRYRFAVTSYRCGNFSDAIDAFQELSEGAPNPERDSILFWLGCSYTAAMQFPGAYDAFISISDRERALNGYLYAFNAEQYSIFARILARLLQDEHTRQGDASQSKTLLRSCVQRIGDIDGMALLDTSGSLTFVVGDHMTLEASLDGLRTMIWNARATSIAYLRLEDAKQERIGYFLIERLQPGAAAGGDASNFRWLVVSFTLRMGDLPLSPRRMAAMLQTARATKGNNLRAILTVSHFYKALPAISALLAEALRHEKVTEVAWALEQIGTSRDVFYAILDHEGQFVLGYLPFRPKGALNDPLSITARSALRLTVLDIGMFYPEPFPPGAREICLPMISDEGVRLGTLRIGIGQL